MIAMKSLRTDNITGINQTGDQPNKPLKCLTASSIIGDKIFNRSGERLGKIMDVMLNIQEAKIEYVIIEFGGFLGAGQKYFAVSFQALSIDTKRHAFILDETKEFLLNAPGFDKEHWPQTNRHRPANSAQWGGFMGANTGSEY